MRFSCSIFINNDKGVGIKPTYRKNFMSLIKEALNPDKNPSEFFHKYYSNKAKDKNIAKPFTFSVYLPVEKREGGCDKRKLLLKNDRIESHFSSSDPIFLMHLYNGLVGLKSGFPLFSEITIGKIANFRLHKEPFFSENIATFKPYSPVLVRQVFKKDEKGETGFISNDEKLLKKALFYNIRFLTKTFADQEISEKNVKIEFPHGVKTSHVRSYGGEAGINGIIEISAPKDVLKLLYDIGLGSKRSQGYGMLGVVQ